jgi:hypothetical protein
VSEERDDLLAGPRRAAHDRVFAEFLEPGPLPPGADVADAEVRLLAALEQELGVELAAPGVAAAPPGRPGPLHSAFAWLRGPVLRPALALAAVLAVTAVAWMQAEGPRGERDQPLLRGPATPAAPGGWAARPQAVPAGAGRVRLTWQPAAGATDYAVVFLGADLTERARVPGLPAPAYELDVRSLPAGLLPGEDILWRVSASAGGDEIARSAAYPLTVPDSIR